MSTLLQDLRYALRQLRRSPAFACTVLLTMALAIGATAALTGVLRATLWNRLPYPAADQLISVSDRNLRGFHANGLVSVLRTADLAAMEHDGRHVFQSLAYYYPNNDLLARAGQEPEAVSGAAVSGLFFQTVGAPPLLGRTLNAADDVINGPTLLVLSYRLWQSSFGGDPDVVGRVVRLGSTQATVVGVMGARFDLPLGTEVWYSGRILPSNFTGYRGEGSRFLVVLARLSPQETQRSATSSANALATRLAAQYPESDAAWGFALTSLRDSLFGEYRRALLLLMAAVGLVLLIAAVNIAGLQLARNAARQGEFSIRGALGISRARLLRQLLTENLLLVLAGSLLGLGSASLLLRVLLSRLPPALLAIDHPHVDMSVYLIGIALATVMGVLAGVQPWLQASRLFYTAARAAENRVVGARSQRFGNVFVTAQIALSLVLLMVAASVLHGLYALLQTPLGFDATQVATFTVDLPWRSEIVQRHQLYASLEQQVAARPGVRGIGAISALPLSDFSVRLSYDIAGQPPTPNRDAVVAEGRDITPGYRAAMHIPLLAGRIFSAHDAEPGAPRVFLANRAFAMRYFPASSPVGQHLTATYDELHLAPGGKGAADAGEIVGVLGDVQGTAGSLGSPAQPELYRPEMGGWPHMQFAVRSSVLASTLEREVRRDVAGLSTTASLSHFTTLASSLDRSEAQPRLNAFLLTAFGAFATLLTVVGAYGLAAFGLAQRTRELALRMALGSTRQAIFALMVNRILRLLITGLLLGLGGSFALMRLLASTAVGTLSFSPAWFGATTLLLSSSVLIAIVGPARQATNIDPIEALRTE